MTFDGRQVTWQDFFDSGGRCATPNISSVETRPIGQRLKGLKVNRKNLKETTLIKVFFHVIQNPAGDGYIAKSQIDEQMTVLNASFGNHFKFHLTKIDRPINSEWYENMYHTSPAEAAAIEALGVREKDVLNIYTAHLKGSNGWAFYPWEFSANPYRDGVMIRFSTLPGGTQEYYDKGKTLVHEVGHWLGLFHTFSNSCYPPGDYVDDTAPEQIEGRRCYLGRDSCPGDKDPDPVQNFMDYSEDKCTIEFTPKQLERMDSKFEMCRRQPGPCSP